MRLVCYPTSGDPPRIVPAPVTRDWMEDTGEGFAYRCLPLNIANAHGWMILNQRPFAARWNGGMGLDAVAIQPFGNDPADSRDAVIASSHFGNGVLTFNVAGLFRTEPGYDLMVTGPFNQPKDAIQPLTGIVETDWSPFTFTMNWRFTRRHTTVTFGRDEAVCLIFPLKRGLLEEVEPVFRALENDPPVAKALDYWSKSREEFNRDLRKPGSPARAEKWQKDYFRGSGQAEGAPDDHRTRLRLKPFGAE
jgi:hypothetical protein